MKIGKIKDAKKMIYIYYVFRKLFKKNSLKISLFQKLDFNLNYRVIFVNIWKMLGKIK